MWLLEITESSQLSYGNFVSLKKFVYSHLHTRFCAYVRNRILRNEHGVVPISHENESLQQSAVKLFKWEMGIP